MKVIDEGKGDWRPWWAGQRMTCRECGRVVELELKDGHRANWKPASDDRVTLSCERCGNMVRLDRETLQDAKNDVQSNKRAFTRQSASRTPLTSLTF